MGRWFGRWFGGRQGRVQGDPRRPGGLPHGDRNWVCFGGGIWRVYFGLRCGIGFVWYFFYLLFFKFGAEGAEAFEFFDGTAVVALGLGLIAQEEGPGMRPLGQAVKALGDGEIVSLAEGDFTLAQAGHFLVHGVDGFAVGSKSLVEASGEKAGFEAGGADEGHLAQGDPFDGPEFLGVGRVVEVEEVVAEVADFVKVFQMDDGEGGDVGAVLASILGRLGFAGGRTGAGGFPRVAAVGSDLLLGSHMRGRLRSEERRVGKEGRSRWS